MKRAFLLLFIFCSTILSRAQIAKVELGEGTQGANVTDIIVVFKMHFDIGYTDWAEGILQKYTGKMLTETLKEIDATYALPKEEQFVWTVPSWPLKYIIENCPIPLRSSLDRALREGRITPHALPITYETEASDLETLVRGLAYSDNIRKAAGRELARDAKLTDVPSHSFALPTILANAGVDFFHLGCNAGSKSPDIPVLSFWEGPDGKRILFLNWAEYYGSGVLPPKDWPHKTWLAMIHTHENTGAPTAEEVAAVLKEAKEKMPHAKVRIGELKDFYDGLMAEKPNLPILKGDLPDSWIHGFMSNPRQQSLARQLHRQTYTTEALGNLLTQWGVPQLDTRVHIAKAIENQILFDEHTFGIAMTHGNQQYWAFGDRFQVNKSLGEYDYAETSWYEKQNRIHEAERTIRPITRNQMRELAAKVNSDKGRLVVFNPDPWERSDRVNMFMGVYLKNFTVYAMKDLTTGKIIPAHNRDNLLSFDAEAVPPMGYKTYEVILEPRQFASTVQLDSINNILENRFFKIVINPSDGSLSSVYDKVNKKELADNKGEYKFSQFVHELYGQEDLDRYTEQYIRKSALGWAQPEMGRPYTTNEKKIVGVGKGIKLIYEPMSNGGRISVMGETDQTGIQFITNYTLYADQPYVEITCGVNSKTPDARPEAGWLAFPFAIQSPNYRVLRLGGIVDPTKDFVDYTNQYYYYTNGSVALYDNKGSGITLDNPEAPAISIDSTGMFRFGRKFVPKTGLVFGNLFSTQWGTNFTEWIEGSFHATYRIRSYHSFDPAKSLAVPAEESRSPLLAAYAKGKGGELPLSQTGVAVSQPGVYVTAFAPNDTGSLLRLWDQTGKSQKVTVTLPQGSKYTQAQWCNLRGVPVEGKVSRIENGKFTVEIGKNEPLTFMLK